MIILKLYGFLFISLYIIYTILHYFMENKIDRYLFAFDECSKLLSKCVWLEKKKNDTSAKRTANWQYIY